LLKFAGQVAANNFLAIRQAGEDGARRLHQGQPLIEGPGAAGIGRPIAMSDTATTASASSTSISVKPASLRRHLKSAD
jgi:hypothetical protein